VKLGNVLKKNNVTSL